MKKCPKCGNELADDAKFCNACGMSLDTPVTQAVNEAASDAGAPASAPVSPAAPLGGAAPAAEPKKKTNMYIGVAVVAVLCIVVIALLASLLGGSYKKPIKTLVSAVNGRSTNVTKYLGAVTPSFVSSTYNSLRGLLKGGDAKEELDDTIKEVFEDYFDELEDEYGSNWRVSIEYKNAKKLRDKDVDEIQDAWEDFYKTIKDLDLDDEDTWEYVEDYLDDEYDTEINIEKAADLMEKFVDNLGDVKITAAYEVKLKITIKGKDGKDSETVTINVIKCNGQWIIDPLSTSIPGVGSLSSLLWMARYHF